MNQDRLEPDDAVLAAYVAGILPASKQCALKHLLAQDERLRHTVEAASRHLSTPLTHSLPSPPPSPTSQASTTALLRVSSYVIVALTFFLVGLGLRGGFADATAFTAGIPKETATFSSESGEFALAWLPIQNASFYEVVIWDEAASQSLAQFTTKQPHLLPEETLTEPLASQVEVGAMYTLRIDAYDASGNFVHRAAPQRFTWPPS